MNDSSSHKKSGKAKKILTATIIIAGAAYGYMTYINGDPDPSTWELYYPEGDSGESTITPQ